jgi:hypothetical protein
MALRGEVSWSISPQYDSTSPVDALADRHWMPVVKFEIGLTVNMTP